ncbi:MAG: tail fiber protein [Sphingomonas sp.]
MLIATTAAAAATGLAAPAQAQDFYLGQVIATAGQYCPPGFLEPAGQILPIGQYTALFAVIGPVFGGDGRTNFGLPDLRGRGIVQWGQGPGLLPIQFGASIGADQVSLSLAQLAPHAHTGAVIASTAAPTAPNPAGNVLATFPRVADLRKRDPGRADESRHGADRLGGRRPADPDPQSRCRAALLHRQQRPLSAAALTAGPRATAREAAHAASRFSS